MTMNKKIIEHLRRFSSVPGKEKTWVSQLSDDQLYEVFLKIRNGENARAIARHVQKAWRVNPKSSLHSLSQGILKFKERIGHLLPLSSVTGEIKYNDLHLPPDGDDPLETMENIAVQYEARIKRMIAEEKESGVKYPFISRDLQALASLRKAILKQKEWEATHEDPLKRKRRKRMEKDLDWRFRAVMDNFGEDGRDRMIRALNRFLELAEQKAVPMYRKADGTYTLTDPEEKPGE